MGIRRAKQSSRVLGRKELRHGLYETTSASSNNCNASIKAQKHPKKFEKHSSQAKLVCWEFLEKHQNQPPLGYSFKKGYQNASAKSKKWSCRSWTRSRSRKTSTPSENRSRYQKTIEEHQARSTANRHVALGKEQELALGQKQKWH